MQNEKKKKRKIRRIWTVVRNSKEKVCRTFVASSKQPKTKCPAKLRAPSGPGVPALALRSSPVYNLFCAQVQDLLSYLYFFSWLALHRQYIDNIAGFTASQICGPKLIKKLKLNRVKNIWSVQDYTNGIEKYKIIKKVKIATTKFELKPPRHSDENA